MKRLVRVRMTALITGLMAVFLVIGLPLGAAAGPLPAAAGRPAAAGAPAGAAGGQRGQTVVTFAWGGGNASQMPGLPLLRKYGMRGTYYIPSGLVCFPQPGVSCAKSQYLTLPDIRRIAAGGNEIGGLTVTHTHLNPLPTAEAKRQICNDRVNLTRWGFRVTDFAYPYAVQTPRIEALARQCGYNSALSAGETRGARGCPQCIYAETIPPPNPMLIRAPVEVNASGYHWTPATFEHIVTGAQRHGGGWIVFLIHDICRSYCRYGVTSQQLEQVLAWVHQRVGPGLAVKTVRQVIGGPVRKAIPGPAPAGARGGGVANGSLADLAATGYPACFQPADYGRNTVRFSYHRGGGPGGYATETLRMTSQRSGDAKLLIETDLGECSPPAVPGRTYKLGAWYKTSSPRTQIDVYYRNQIGAWRYWTSSPRLPATSDWREASWTTPPVPAGATGISFGLAATGPGTVVTTGYTVTRAHPGRLHLMVVGLVLLALAAPFLGWPLWHARVRQAARAGAAASGDPAGEPGPRIPTSSG